MAGVKPRVISLSKREGQSYGFYLRVEEGIEGHLVRALEMGGSAELAGLKDGDRIIRVNGIFVDNLEHLQVADLVKKSGLTVTFHVLEEEAYKHAKSNNINLAEPQSTSALTQPTMNGVSASGPKLKLCFLQKSSSGFGFSIKSLKGEEGKVMMDVIAGSIAGTAGVKAGDRLVEINGENVEASTHDQTVEKVKAAGNSVMLLLADEDTEKYYKNKRIALRSELATTRYLPLKPRIADMTRGADGYGFFLKADPKTPEKAGLKEMDQLVAVDGEEVIRCTHDQVVDKIRQVGNRCCLLVVDAETDKMYTMGGISPLIYWEEMRSSLLQTSNPEPEHNATPVPAMPEPVEKVYEPKLCRMEKTAAGYGFHLNGIQGVYGQYIKDVVKGGAADRAGLKDDDIVVEVNGVNIEQSTHEEAVNLIRSSGHTLELLVAEKDAYDYMKSKGIAMTKMPDKENIQPVQPRARTPSVSSTSSSGSEDVRL
ncbi:Na(+)/H(+) exchange regulatory cofactor NHE-RF3 [Bagarius yarrelli]|uniref:Na(+)/H(+) exchange regulatory cofactor NHE-RF3 n=1 Tax=Bagarius yarrelli TaxID=175774 RepID=A0A556TXW4_BAGYA|nr:Na(+)/H(+) exchange regulatory cofactor NHE-RF3 [Bagarius yarrelli]